VLTCHLVFDDSVNLNKTDDNVTESSKAIRTSVKTAIGTASSIRRNFVSRKYFKSLKQLTTKD